jgi:hypothetical protein
MARYGDKRNKHADPRARSVVVATFSVPDHALHAVGQTAATFPGWMTRMAALFIYGRGEVSLGTAAAIAGMTTAEFMALVKSYHLPTAHELPAEIDEAVARLSAARDPS